MQPYRDRCIVTDVQNFAPNKIDVISSFPVTKKCRFWAVSGFDQCSVKLEN